MTMTSNETFSFVTDVVDSTNYSVSNLLIPVLGHGEAAQLPAWSKMDPNLWKRSRNIPDEAKDQISVQSREETVRNLLQGQPAFGLEDRDRSDHNGE